jgi:ABC-2 type transport system ATP-binding protein
MIELDVVSRSFGPVQAVQRLSFTVPSGAICGFLGPNGAGKSTTLRMIAGAIAPDEGSIRLAGVDLEIERGRALAGLGWLPEHAPLPADLRVEEMLDVRARLYGLDRRARRTAVEEAIRSCVLGEMRRRLCGQLSKGYRQRAGLAAAVVHRPRVLILDEPTSGLDPGQVDEFRSLVRSMRGRTTLLLSTHVLSEVETLCEHVVVIDRGSLLVEGAVTDFRRGKDDTLEDLYRGLLGGGVGAAR